MGVYANTFRDFPLRVFELWQRYRNDAEDNKREVTLLFMVASAGLSMPYEFYKSNKNKKNNYNNSIIPAVELNEGDELNSFVSEMSRLLSKNIGSLKLIDRSCISKWKYNFVDNFSQVDQCIESGSFKDLNQLDDHRSLISRLRNSIAHFGIKTIPVGNGNEIDKVVFVSEKKDHKTKVIEGYHVYQVDPITFEDFLENWFNAIREIYVKYNYEKYTRYYQTKLSKTA